MLAPKLCAAPLVLNGDRAGLARLNVDDGKGHVEQRRRLRGGRCMLRGMLRHSNDVGSAQCLRQSEFRPNDVGADGGRRFGLPAGEESGNSCERAQKISRDRFDLVWGVIVLFLDGW